MQQYLNKKAHEYLQLIANEYSKYMTEVQIKFLQELLNTPEIVAVEVDDVKYIENQKQAINEGIKDETMRSKALESLTTPVAHGARVFEDGKIHFYPFILKGTDEEKRQTCEEMLVHELLHYFIRPKYMLVNNVALNGVNSYVTEGLVDICARDLQEKYKLFPEYHSNYAENVIFLKDVMNDVDQEEKYHIAFRSSVEELVKHPKVKSIDDSKSLVDDYKLLVKELVELCTTEHQHAIWYKLMNTTASFPNVNYMLNYLRGILNAKYPDKMEEINKKLEEFKKEKGIGPNPITDSSSFNM